MIDKLMAILGLATMIAFLGTVVVFVPDVDLIVVVVFVSALATYDFWRTFREQRNTHRKG
jgi:hypothetical protein